MNGPKLDTGSNGVIPSIFSHYTALPQCYDLEHVVEEKLSDKVKRQFVMGAQTMFVKWTLKKDAIIPLHFHPNEQIAWILEGMAQVKSQGKTFTVKTGQVIVFPAFVPHEFLVVEDMISIDFFTPVRHDWLIPSADAKKS